MKRKSSLSYLLAVLMASCVLGCASAQLGEDRSVCGNMNVSEEERTLLEETSSLVLKAVVPQYPTSPYKRKTYKGCVLVGFDINTNGRAENIKIIRLDSESSTFFSRSAMKAVEKYEFKKVSSIRDALLLLSFDLDLDA